MKNKQFLQESNCMRDSKIIRIENVTTILENEKYEHLINDSNKIIEYK